MTKKYFPIFNSFRTECWKKTMLAASQKLPVASSWIRTKLTQSNHNSTPNFLNEKTFSISDLEQKLTAFREKGWK